MFIRSGFPFNYDTDEASEESGLDCKDPSLALQSQAEEADINTIVRRFGLTGQLPVGLRVPKFADFEGIFDFQTAMNVVRTAEEAFMQLPATVRSRFHNDPQELVAFVSDAANRAEAEKLGLLVVPEVIPEVVPPVVVPPAV